MNGPTLGTRRDKGQTRRAVQVKGRGTGSILKFLFHSWKLPAPVPQKERAAPRGECGGALTAPQPSSPWPWGPPPRAADFPSPPNQGLQGCSAPWLAPAITLMTGWEVHGPRPSEGSPWPPRPLPLSHSPPLPRILPGPAPCRQAHLRFSDARVPGLSLPARPAPPHLLSRSPPAQPQGSSPTRWPPEGASDTPSFCPTQLASLLPEPLCFAAFPRPQKTDPEPQPHPLPPPAQQGPNLEPGQALSPGGG